MVSMELKESALNEGAIRQILSVGRRLDLLSNLFFWFGMETGDDSFKLARLLKQLEPDAHIGIVYKDVPSNGQMPTPNMEVSSLRQLKMHTHNFCCFLFDRKASGERL